MLEAENLVKRFGRITASDHVSLTLGADGPENVFVVGPNGAGKTTLVNLLTGYHAPDEGSVHLDGEDIMTLAVPERVDRGLVRSFQVVEVFEETTVRENVRIAVLSEQGRTSSLFSLRDEFEDTEERVDELIAQFGLCEYEYEPAEQLPHGTRKLLDVAITFALEPDYLILDEPTSGVSSREKNTVIETITSASKERDVTTLTIEHDMDIVREHADRVIALHQGEIIGRGAPSILDTDDELRRILLGVEA